MKQISTTFTLLFLLAFAQPVFAATPPPNVTSVRADYIGGALVVNWGAVQDPAGIDFYRIYFSRQSILQNQGDYDDVERTQGTATTYTFERAPFGGKKVFVSVMAVNKDGLESEAFEVESSAVLTSASSGTTSSTPTSSATSSATRSSSSKSSSVSNISSSATQVSSQKSSSSIATLSSSAEPLQLMRVRAISSTGVLLEFSKPLDATVPTADAFAIVDGSGSELMIKSVAFSGSTNLIVNTASQRPQVIYALGLTKTLKASDGATIPAPLPELTFFSFMMLPVTSSASSVQSSAPMLDTTPPNPVQNLAISFEPKPDGTYDVMAFWQASASADLASYLISTTKDGKIYSAENPLNIGETGATFRGLKPGTFGVRVIARDTTGNRSMAVERTIKLPELPKTGAGTLAILMAAGAFAGQRLTKRKRI